MNENVTIANPNDIQPNLAAVKAVGDWELDVLAVPFGEHDSDGQYFDAETDIMPDAFSTPVAIYQHGVKQGAGGMQDKPIVVGKTVPGTLTKQADGWHIRVVLDKALKVAQDIMTAAWKNMVAVSSDAVSHLSRLQLPNGKIIMYEKNRAGRIAVWPLAGVSLWEKGNGNLQPASRRTYALPAMKAIYRDAGLQFPDVSEVTDGVLSEASTDAVKRAKNKEIEKAKQILKRTRKWVGE